ncbi:MAG TPA: hypothetical protein VFV38_42040 [Ktedonobacteraceae bacterium]|nr:hypothetical protein [Ktedonobacteraceae bacterium]
MFLALSKILLKVRNGEYLSGIRLNAILEREHTGWPALVLHERHIGDFTGWKEHNQYQVAFERLLRDLKQTDE